MEKNIEENILNTKRKNLDIEISNKILEIKQNRDSKWYIQYATYSVSFFLREVFWLLKDLDPYIKSKSHIEITYLDKNKFDADICIKIPVLLEKYKSAYAMLFPSKIIEILNKSLLVANWIISKMEVFWIYVNISFWDTYLYLGLHDIFDKWDKYWENDINKWKSIIVDYSSPNIWKHLHAGHIRSTIIGDILSNLYEANGYYTHRINHINDWWGFWFLIEWYIRWNDKIETFTSKNDLLFQIYSLYRKWEKVYSSITEYKNLSDEDISYLKKFYSQFSNYEEFISIFDNFILSSKKRFFSLENWEEKEVQIWENIIDWSMQEFNKFYDLLWIKIDYTIGESFYAQYWKELIFTLEKENIVVFYDKNLANKDLQKLHNLLEEEKIDRKFFDIRKEEILDDISAYVIDLWNFERFVVLKWDKSSIYATRDLWAIKYRFDKFKASRMIYEVWQEQSEHFDKLFKSAKKMWIDNVDFRHIYHGFYINSKTKKKLSSRDGASDVQNLIFESISYFKSKYKNTNFSPEEIDDISYKLAIWSIIFNDIKSDKKNPVFISDNINETCMSFEESGWAYIIYSIVRAKSILNKIEDLDYFEFDLSEVYEFDYESSLEETERIIINDFNRYPIIIKTAQENDNPSILADYILNLSRNYNTYYNSYRVIDGKNIIKQRLFITKAFLQIALNAVKICKIQVPEKI